MIWLRIDDGFDVHPKARLAGNAAVGLCVRWGAYCSRMLTDGFVSEDVAELYGRPAEIRALTAAGLWVPKDGGYHMSGFERSGWVRQNGTPDSPGRGKDLPWKAH